MSEDANSELSSMANAFPGNTTSVPDFVEEDELFGTAFEIYKSGLPGQRVHRSARGRAAHARLRRGVPEDARRPAVDARTRSPRPRPSGKRSSRPPARNPRAAPDSTTGAAHPRGESRPCHRPPAPRGRPVQAAAGPGADAAGRARSAGSSATLTPYGFLSPDRRAADHPDGHADHHGRQLLAAGRRHHQQEPRVRRLRQLRRGAHRPGVLHRGAQHAGVHHLVGGRALRASAWPSR